ncbi:death domain-associated protein 6 [Elysia marginata]|uniref:Death domain-associated protein 6 n=1 Tax=Elysia marginata TaxID=1093978 RepID=A0AAV4IFB3_9GAST|nr:death domain-associated protein 6 [Elysia marginata]
MRNSSEMVDLLERTMANMKEEPYRAFVHLKDLVNQLKLWSKVKQAKKASSPVCKTSIETKGENERSGKNIDQEELRGKSGDLRVQEERKDDSPTPAKVEPRVSFPPLNHPPIKNDCKVVLVKTDSSVSQLETDATQNALPSPSKSHKVAIVDGRFDQASVIIKANQLDTASKLPDEPLASTPGPSSVVEESTQQRFHSPKPSIDSWSSKGSTIPLSRADAQSPRKNAGVSPHKSTVILEVNSSSPEVQHIQSASHSKQNILNSAGCKVLQFKTHSVLPASNLSTENASSESTNKNLKRSDSCVVNKNSFTPMKPISSAFDSSASENILGETDTPVEKNFKSSQESREQTSSRETECYGISGYIDHTARSPSIRGLESSHDSSASTIDPESTIDHSSVPQVKKSSVLLKGGGFSKDETSNLGKTLHEDPKMHKGNDILFNSIAQTDIASSEALIATSHCEQPEDDLNKDVLLLEEKGEGSDRVEKSPASHGTDNTNHDSDTTSLARSRRSSSDTVVNEEQAEATESNSVEALQHTLIPPADKSQGKVTVRCSTGRDDDKVGDMSKHFNLAKDGAAFDNHCDSPGFQDVPSTTQEAEATFQTKPASLKHNVSVIDEMNIASRNNTQDENVEVKSFVDIDKNICGDNQALYINPVVDNSGTEKAKGHCQQYYPDVYKLCSPDVTLCGDKGEESFHQVKKKEISNQDQKTEGSSPIQVADQDSVLKKLPGGKERAANKPPRRAVLIPCIVKIDESEIAKKLRRDNLNQAISRLKPSSSGSTQLKTKGSGNYDGPSSGDEFVSDAGAEKEPKVSHENLSPEEIKRRKHIRKLEKLLESLRDEIEKCQARELSIEDMGAEDSSYIYEDKLKKKFVDAWKKLCEITKRTVETGRPTERTIRFNSTRYKEINRRLEKFLNKSKSFPDIHDVKNVIKMTNTKYKLGLSSPMMQNIAREAFVDIGEMLQSRRHEDFIATFGTRQTDALRMGYGGMDPYWTDPELRRKLDRNRETAKYNLEKVIAKYTQLQETKGNQDSDDDDDDDEEDENETYAKTSVHRDNRGIADRRDLSRDRTRKDDIYDSERDDLDEDDDGDEETSSSVIPGCSKSVPKSSQKSGPASEAVTSIASGILGPSHYLTSSRKRDAVVAVTSSSSKVYDDGNKLGLSDTPVPIDIDQKSHYLESVGLLSLPMNPYLHKKEVRSPSQSAAVGKISYSLPSSPASIIYVEDSPAKTSNSRLGVLSVDKENEVDSHADQTTVANVSSVDDQLSSSKLETGTERERPASTVGKPSFVSLGSVEEMEDQTSDSDGDSDKDEEEEDDDDIITIISSQGHGRESDSELSRGPSPVSVASFTSNDENSDTANAVTEPSTSTKELDTVGSFADDSTEKTRMLAALNLVRVPGEQNPSNANLEVYVADTSKPVPSLPQVQKISPDKVAVDQSDPSIGLSQVRDATGLAKRSQGGENFPRKSAEQGFSSLVLAEKITNAPSCDVNFQESDNTLSLSSQVEKGAGSTEKVLPQPEKNQAGDPSTYQTKPWPGNLAPNSLCERETIQALYNETSDSETRDLLDRQESAAVTEEEEKMDLDVPECYIDLVEEEEDEDHLPNPNNPQFYSFGCAEGAGENSRVHDNSVHLAADSDQIAARGNTKETIHVDVVIDDDDDDDVDAVPLIDSDKTEMCGVDSKSKTKVSHVSGTEGNVKKNFDKVEVGSFDSAANTEEVRFDTDPVCPTATEKVEAEFQSAKVHQGASEETSLKDIVEPTSSENVYSTSATSSMLKTSQAPHTGAQDHIETESNVAGVAEKNLSTEFIKFVSDSIVTPAAKGMSSDSTTSVSDSNNTDYVVKSLDTSQNKEGILKHKEVTEGTLSSEKSLKSSEHLKNVHPLPNTGSVLLSRDKDTISDSNCVEAPSDETSHIDPGADQIILDCRETAKDVATDAKVISRHDVLSSVQNKSTSKHHEANDEVGEILSAAKTRSIEILSAAKTGSKVNEPTCVSELGEEAVADTTNTSAPVRENVSVMKNMEPSAGVDCVADTETSHDTSTANTTALPEENSKLADKDRDTNDASGDIASLGDELVGNSCKDPVIDSGELVDNSSEGPVIDSGKLAVVDSSNDPGVIDVTPHIPFKEGMSASGAPGSYQLSNKDGSQDNPPKNVNSSQDSDFTTKDTCHRKSSAVKEISSTQNVSKDSDSGSGREDKDVDNSVQVVKWNEISDDKRSPKATESGTENVTQDKNLVTITNLSLDLLEKHLSAADTGTASGAIGEKRMNEATADLSLESWLTPASSATKDDRLSQRDKQTEQDTSVQSPSSDDNEQRKAESMSEDKPSTPASCSDTDIPTDSFQEESTNVICLAGGVTDKPHKDVDRDHDTGSQIVAPSPCIDDDKKSSHCEGLREGGSEATKETGDSSNPARQSDDDGNEKQSMPGTQGEEQSRTDNEGDSTPATAATKQAWEEKMKGDLFEFISEICNNLIESATNDEANEKDSDIDSEVKRDSSPTQEDKSSRSGEDVASLGSCGAKDNASAKQSTNVESKNSGSDVDTVNDEKIEEVSSKDGGECTEAESQDNLEPAEDVKIIEELSDAKGVRVSCRSKEEDRQIVDALLTAITPGKKDTKQQTSNSKPTNQEDTSAASDDKDCKSDEGKKAESDPDHQERTSSSAPEKDTSTGNDEQPESGPLKESLTKISDSKSGKEESSQSNSGKQTREPDSKESAQGAGDAEPSSEPNSLKRKGEETAAENNSNTCKENEDDDVAITSVELAGPPAKKQKTTDPTPAKKQKVADPSDITDIIRSVYHGFPAKKTAHSSPQSSSRPSSCGEDTSSDVIMVEDSTAVKPVSVYRNHAYLKQKPQDSSKQVVGASASLSLRQEGWRGGNSVGTSGGLSRNTRSEHVGTKSRGFSTGSLAGEAPRQKPQAPKIIIPRPYIPYNASSQKLVPQMAGNQLSHHTSGSSRHSSFPSQATMNANNKSMPWSPFSTANPTTSHLPRSKPQNFKSTGMLPSRHQGVSSRAAAQTRTPPYSFPPGRILSNPRPFNKATIGQSNVSSPYTNFSNLNTKPVRSSHNFSPSSRQGFPSQYGQPPPRKAQKNLDGLKIVLDNSDEEDNDVSAVSRKPSDSRKRKPGQDVTPKIVSVCSLNRPAQSTAAVRNKPGLSAPYNRHPDPAKSSEAEQIVLSDSD